MATVVLGGCGEHIGSGHSRWRCLLMEVSCTWRHCFAWCWEHSHWDFLVQFSRCRSSGLKWRPVAGSVKLHVAQLKIKSTIISRCCTLSFRCGVRLADVCQTFNKTFALLIVSLLWGSSCQACMAGGACMCVFSCVVWHREDPGRLTGVHSRSLRRCRCEPLLWRPCRDVTAKALVGCACSAVAATREGQASSRHVKIEA